MKGTYKVYKHTFPNGKCYIGITSLEPSIRWGCKGKKYLGQPFLWNAIEKYGWENTKHEILHENLTKEEAELKEIELIAKYKSNQREFGYNIDNGGKCEGTHSEETKRKIGDAHRNKIVNDVVRRKISISTIGKKNHNSKAVIQYDLDGNFIKKWDCVMDAVRKLNFKTHSHIIEVCNNNKKSAYGYVWKFIKEDEKNEIAITNTKKRKHERD